MDNINDIESFDNYLHNKLSGTEKVNFEKKLNTEITFKQDFELHKIVVNGIVSVANSELKIELHNIHEQRGKQFKKRVGFYLFFLSLIFLGFWLATLDHKPLSPPVGKMIFTTIDSIKLNTPLASTEKIISDSIPIKNTSFSNVVIPIKSKESTSIAMKMPLFALTEAGTKVLYIAEFTTQPQYMFFNNTVHLVGWNNILPSQIDLRIRKEKLYIFIDRIYYELQETNIWTNAGRVKDTRDFGALQFGRGKSMKIGVLIHPLKIERSAKYLNLFTTDSLSSARWYNFKNNQLVLSLKGKSGLNKGRLVDYENQLYLKTSKSMFMISRDGVTHDFKSIKLSGWEGKEIIELYVKPRYLNFGDEHNLQQAN